MKHQIIGQNLDLAFKELSIKGMKMYESKEDEYGNKYQVWQLVDNEYDKLMSVDNNEWNSKYGWFRKNGCNDTSSFLTFKINGKDMIGFKNEHSHFHHEDYLCELEDWESETPDFCSFSDWISEYMGMSKPENLAYYAHTLAKHNGLTNSEFFKKFEG